VHLVVVLQIDRDVAPADGLDFLRHQWPHQPRRNEMCTVLEGSQQRLTHALGGRLPLDGAAEADRLMLIPSDSGPYSPIMDHRCQQQTCGPEATTAVTAFRNMSASAS
jgi:hypothetical protein